MPIVSISIVDDDSLIVKLLNQYLNGSDLIKVIITATNGTDFLSQLETVTDLPDVLLLDLKMSGIDGIQITEIIKLKYPSINIIIISSHYNISFMGFMLKTGISAFLPKGISPIELIDIIVAVKNKGFYFLPEQINMIRQQVSSKVPRPVLEEAQLLSEREIQILKLICQTKKLQKEIGDQLFIAQRTVEGHKNNLFTKTGAKNIAGLVIYAFQQGIIDPNHLPII